MWFKNIRAYRLTGPFDLSPEQLSEQMQSALYQPCAKSQPMSLGWVPALGENSEALAHAAAGRILLCMRREEKILPASVVREQVADRVREIEQEEGRKVYRKEKLRLKDEITQDCLPRAFSRSTTVHAYIDTRARWLFVDSTSAARAEELVTLLRECIGSLPLVLPRVNQSPAAAMTAWVLHRNLPQDFILQQDCEMKDPGEDGGVVRCKGIELAGEETDIHLQAGKQVVKLALQWDEKVSFMLAEDLCIRRLRFVDELVAENDDIAEADPLARMDADFLLMSEVVTELQDRIVSLFGGESTE
jgi:recombination associated protein RdgC